MFQFVSLMWVDGRRITEAAGFNVCRQGLHNPNGSRYDTCYTADIVSIILA